MPRFTVEPHLLNVFTSLPRNSDLERHETYNQRLSFSVFLPHSFYCGNYWIISSLMGMWEIDENGFLLNTRQRESIMLR